MNFITKIARGIVGFVSKPAPTAKPTPTSEPISTPKSTSTPKPSSVSAKSLPEDVHAFAKQPRHQNGVSRPQREGTQIMLVWILCNKFYNEHGRIPTTQEIVRIGIDHNCHSGTVSVQYGQWRKYYGFNRNAPISPISDSTREEEYITVSVSNPSLSLPEDVHAFEKQPRMQDNKPRPMEAGSMGMDMWLLFNKFYNANGRVLTGKERREIAKEKGYNFNTMSTQHSTWVGFYGLNKRL